ncbi:RNA 2',3'-cyclic phosphodiesterase [Candidatus Pacearchaeota archaeon]|jgi:2'-5' RNA ligase|nr:RNA 2',3'-cyclic phosphodiesterase [Candidatus Pacearchaeota archaeon]
MRTFIAIDIPEEVKEKIIEIQKQLPEFKGKLTEKENLHLTLKFLGEVNEEKIERVKEELGKIKLKSFKAEIDSIGVFDNIESKNYSSKLIVWLHVKNCNELQKKIDNQFFKLFARERRFMGHLTIARIKKIKDKKKFLEEINKIKLSSMNFFVKSFELKKSVLTEQKPVYETLESYNLN